MSTSAGGAPRPFRGNPRSASCPPDPPPQPSPTRGEGARVGWSVPVGGGRRFDPLPPCGGGLGWGVHPTRRPRNGLLLPFRRLAALPPILVTLALCAVPYLSRLRWPSLYADDVDRIAQLQTGTLRGFLLAPFNEHLAPLFQTVSWLTWQLSGARLARAPIAFTLASSLPFLLTLALLGWVLRRETRSTAAAL